jgi:hypothetical protein
VKLYKNANFHLAEKNNIEVVNVDAADNAAKG